MYMVESFQDYFWIQDFEADFLKKSVSKSRISQILTASLIYFQFILGQLTI